VTTDPWVDRLSEYVDGDLDVAATRDLEAHLATCAECRATRDELVRVVTRARRVGYRTPERDLWSRIEAQVAPPRAEASMTQIRPRHVTMSVWRLAAAAAIVATLAGGLAWMVATSGGSAITVVADTTITTPTTPVLPPSAFAVASYREAAADLQRAFDAGRGTLRPETMRVIEENLRSIDVAIAQADSALRADPGSEYLNQYLAETMQRKLKLLRRAVEITTARS
jgi:predicted nucleic acid-binding protein